MHLHRLYSNSVLLVPLLVLMATCAGCWEKIPYTGPRTTAARPKSTAEASRPQPPKAESPKSLASGNEQDTAARNPERDAVAKADDATPPPPPTVTENTPAAKTDDLYSTPKDDLYSTPPEAASEGSTTAPPGETPNPTAAASSSNVGDRYATVSKAEAPPAKQSEQAAAPTLTADNPPTGTPPVAMSKRRAAWILGSRLSLAALANDRGVATANVPIWFKDAQSAAKFLNTTVGDLPEPPPAGDPSLASKQVINYLVANGQRVGRELPADESALFEVAIKSNILLLLYMPNSTAGGSVAEAITRAAPQAKLPAELWQPLIDALKKKLPQADVQAAVRKMHIDIEQYLALEAEQSGK